MRPPTDKRLFQSKSVDQEIEKLSKLIKDADIRQMFVQCFPNTLDTSVYHKNGENGEHDTFVSTGDIPAMWLRDSTNQLWPYLRYAKKDKSLSNLFAGLIRRQTEYIILDPYSNGFRDIASLYNGNLEVYPHEGKSWLPGVWERKYELDSLCSFFRLSFGYFEATGDLSIFSFKWIEAIKKSIEVIILEQETLNKENLKKLYNFIDPHGNIHPAIRLEGYGYPGRKCGLTRNVFRPSDDEAVFPYLIPANAMCVVTLKQIAKILEKINQNKLAQNAIDLANEIDIGIKEWGIVDHKTLGRIYAYEVDGFGSSCIMDDPNIPSLLSMPYLGYCLKDDPVYVATRKMILSEANPFFAKGKAAEGVTSPHTGVLSHFWPMATIMQALTTEDEVEIIECLKTLKRTHGGTYFMHESVNVDDTNDFTRGWFCWANSLFGELILEIAKNYPGILSKEI